MDEPDLITRAIRFTNTTRPNSIDNRRALQLVRELLQHINEMEKQTERESDKERIYNFVSACIEYGRLKMPDDGTLGRHALTDTDRDYLRDILRDIDG